MLPLSVYEVHIFWLVDRRPAFLSRRAIRHPHTYSCVENLGGRKPPRGENPRRALLYYCLSVWPPGFTGKEGHPLPSTVTQAYAAGLHGAAFNSGMGPILARWGRTSFSLNT